MTGLERRLRSLEEQLNPPKVRKPLTIGALGMIAWEGADPDDYFIPPEQQEAWDRILSDHEDDE
jgi:hypothetical protein